MNESKIAVRYAKALFESSVGQGKLENIQEDLNALLLLEQQVPEFKDLLESPVLNASQKQEILKILFEKNVDDLTFRFLMLISENKRDAFLSSVCRVYKDLYKQKKGIMAALVTTAGVLQEKTAERVKLTLENFFKSQIELQAEMNPDLIGGFILRVEDKQLDASVASQLRKIKKGMDQSVIS